MSLLEVAAVVLSAVAGGAVQATLGFGGSFILVPVLAVVAPEVLPGGALLGLLPMVVFIAWRDRADLDAHAVGRVTVGRVPGILLATAVVAVATPRALTALVAVVLLVAVVATAAGWRIRTTPVTQALVGAVSGFTGTAAALGGPPLALLYRDAGGAHRRATMSSVFVIGILLSLTTLTVVGEFAAIHARAGALVGASLVAGAVAAAPLAARWSDHVLRRAVLGWAAVGATTALARAVVG